MKIRHYIDKRVVQLSDLVGIYAYAIRVIRNDKVSLFQANSDRRKVCNTGMPEVSKLSVTVRCGQNNVHSIYGYSHFCGCSDCLLWDDALSHTVPWLLSGLYFLSLH